jgi:hypothetical protein
MRGVVPAGVLLLLWAGVVGACFYCVIVCPMRGGRLSEELPEPQEKKAATWTTAAATAATETKCFSKPFLSVAAAFTFNACLTVAVNTLYIFSTQQTMRASIHFGIQLGLSIFRLVYVVVAFPLLSSPVQSAVNKVRFQFVLLTINNLLIPCVVTAVTSDACFQVQEK